MYQQQPPINTTPVQPPIYTQPVQLPVQSNQELPSAYAQPVQYPMYPPPPKNPMYIASQPQSYGAAPTQQPVYQTPQLNTNINVVVNLDETKDKKDKPYPFVLPQYPCKGTCPSCKEYNETVVKRKWSCGYIFLMILVVLCLLWLGLIIVCYICSNEGNKISYHYCPSCAVYIGKQDNAPIMNKDKKNNKK